MVIPPAPLHVGLEYLAAGPVAAQGHLSCCNGCSTFGRENVIPEFLESEGLAEAIVLFLRGDRRALTR